MPKPTRAAIVTFSSLIAVGAVAGCAAPATSADPPAGSSDTPADASFADGTYTADGDYVAPSGPESVTVTLTVADGNVTAVEVVGHATDIEAKSHQADFVSGISAAVVGKPLAGLSVDRVAGSSLTGKGFNSALDAIRADAAS